MMSSNGNMLTYLQEVEEAAENVLADKREVVDLDRRRNANREALAALDKSSKSHWKGDESRTWITMNNCFIQLPTGTAKKLVQRGNKYHKRERFTMGDSNIFIESPYPDSR